MVTSVNTSGQSILTALGAGGGLNATELATNLVNAEKVPQQNLIDKQKSSYSATVSSVGKVKSSLTVLQSNLTGLGDAKSFQLSANSGDTSRVTVAFKAGISPPTFSNYVQVQQVASPTTVSFPPLSSIDTSVLGTNATPRTLRLVSGTVQNAVVVGSGMQLPTSPTSGVVTINGVDVNLEIDPTLSLSDNRKATILAINANSAQTGVSAVDSGDDTKGITLTSGDGRAIHTSFAPGVATVKFPDMLIGTKVTVAGMTFTAEQDVLGSDVADAFASLTSGDVGSNVSSNLGTFSGTLTGWSAGPVLTAGGDELSFTAASPANLPELKVETSDPSQVITMTADSPWLTSAMTGLSVGDYGSTDGGVATLPGHRMGKPLSSGAGSVVINGTTINVTMGTSVSSNRSAIVAAINAQTKTTGVTAVNNDSDDLGISLTAATGKSISVSFPQLVGSSSINALDVTNSGLSEATVNPPYALEGTAAMVLPSAIKTGTVTINGIDVSITVGINSYDDNRNSIVDAINAAIDDAVNNNGNADLVGITATNSGDSKGITFTSADGRAIKMGLSSNLTAAETGLKPNVLLSMDLTESDTLVTVRDKINTIAGMTATIVQGGTSTDPLYYLSVKSATGAINNFYADVTAVGGTTPLDGADTSNLDPVADGLLGNYYSSLSVGQDAKISIDGVSINSSTNVFDKAIPGVVITAVAPTDSNVPVAINSQVNKTALTSAINSLITGYNQVLATMNAEMAYNSTDNTKSGGLANNAVARTLMDQLRSFTTQSIIGYDDKSHTLADIGVKTNRDGTLTLDQAAFSSALSNSPDTVAAILASKQSVSDSRIVPGSITSEAKTGVYSIKKSYDIPTVSTVSGNAGVAESSTITFKDIPAGGYVTIGGLTFTANAAMSASQVAVAFAGLSSGVTKGNSTTLGSYSGKLQDWNAGAVAGDQLVFTSSFIGNVPDIKVDATSWTINNELAVLNGLTLTAGTKSNSAGISVIIPTELSNLAAIGFSATLNYSKGIIERFNQMINNATGATSSLQSMSDTQTQNLADLDKKQSDLDTRMEAIRLRYLDQFTRVQTLLTQAKSTQSSLTDFQTAWSNSLKSN